MDASWRVEQVPRLSGFVVEWVGPDDYILSRREILYRTNTLNPPFAELGRMPLQTPLGLAGRFGLLRRALRLAYYNVLPLAGGRVFVTFDRAIAIVTPERTAPVGGLERPFRVLRDGCAITADGSVWFGEYVMPHDTPLRIYRLDPKSQNAEVAHIFPAGFARHIHGIYADPYDGSLWCLTGDFNDHARILRSVNGVDAFTVVGSGDESWRAVSMQFRKEAIYYATDAQAQANHIYRIDRRTGVRSAVASLDGPVYYSHRVQEDLFFAVTAERPGARATLWHLDRDDHCVAVASFVKDKLPVNQFQPGTLSFPISFANSPGFYFTGIALSGTYGRTFLCSPDPR